MKNKPTKLLQHIVMLKEDNNLGIHFRLPVSAFNRKALLFIFVPAFLTKRTYGCIREKSLFWTCFDTFNSIKHIKNSSLSKESTLFVSSHKTSLSFLRFPTDKYETCRLIIKNFKLNDEINVVEMIIVCF